MKAKIEIGLMGLGVIGVGVENALREKVEDIAKQVGAPLVVKRILVRDPSKKRACQVQPHLLTTNPQHILDDPGIDIVVEVIGGESPAYDYIKEALSRGKHVVTANKEVIAKHGFELLNLAAEHNVALLYEASAGGGIPLISPLRHDLLANKISAIHAIINGTTNYILTKMALEDIDFTAALREAQELGYAEADPASDIEGIDAAYKLAILAALAFQTEVLPGDVYHEGISRLAARDFRYAKELGYTVKLLAIAKREDNTFQVRVHPTFIPEDLLLAKVNGVFNAVQIDGDLTGRILFYGQGAGALPTSSAILADVIRLAQNMSQGSSPMPRVQMAQTMTAKPISEIETRYYLRMTVADRPGVLAQITRVLGELLISISSVIQKEVDERAQSAEIVIMTHPAQERAMQQAISQMEKLHVVKEISNLIRVED
ncbi:MAG TPA: homoserine dehydrogenase [Dehalococcoidia bacterium]|nr:homoserine dehydrogenase [Dehalococcoidia bacterium]